VKAGRAGGYFAKSPATASPVAVHGAACDPLGCTPGDVTFTIAPDQAPCDNQPSKGAGNPGSATVALAVANIQVGT
jgi:hypothetical protein